MLISWPTDYAMALSKMTLWRWHGCVAKRLRRGMSSALYNNTTKKKCCINVVLSTLLLIALLFSGRKRLIVALLLRYKLFAWLGGQWLPPYYCDTNCSRGSVDNNIAQELALFSRRLRRWVFVCIISSKNWRYSVDDSVAECLLLLERFKGFSYFIVFSLWTYKRFRR